MPTPRPSPAACRGRRRRERRRQADIITGAGPGGGPHVKVFNVPTGQTVRSFFAYDSAFRFGVSVAAGDGDIVTGAGGLTPAEMKLSEAVPPPAAAAMSAAWDVADTSRVRVFRGSDLSLLADFRPYGSFLGGVDVATDEVDGAMDIVTGAGPGGGPHVEVFDGTTLAPLASFYAYDPTFLGGVFVG